MLYMMRRSSNGSSFSLQWALTGFIGIVGFSFLSMSGGGAVGERAVSSAQRLDLARAGTAQRFRPRRLSGNLI